MCLRSLSLAGLTIIPVFILVFAKTGSCPPVSKTQNTVQAEVNDYDISNRNEVDVGKSAAEQNSNKNRYESIAGLHVLTGKSQEWTNFKHSKPIKRSKDPLNDTSVPNPLLPDCLGGLNMSDPLSKYHCPINLLYGNNLTVKNFFLMVPRCNESTNDTLYRLDSNGQVGTESKPFQESEQNANGTVNEVGSLLSNSPPDSNSAQPPTSIEIKSTQDTESAALTLSTISLGMGTETYETLNITTSSADTSQPFQNVTSEDSLNSSVLNEIPSSEGMSTSLPNESLALATTLNATPETSAASSFDSSVSSNAIIASTELPGNSSSGPENCTTLDMSNEILRTLDKYCETYIATSDKSTSTSPPAMVQQQAHFHTILDENNKVVKIVARVDQPEKHANIMKLGNKF